MKDTFDCRIQLGPLTADISFHYEGNVIYDNDGDENVDNVCLEAIEVHFYNGDDFVFTLDYADISELNLDKAQENLVKLSEEKCFEEYINDDTNKIHSYEYYSDANDSYGEER